MTLCDSSEIQEAFDESIVDCYGEDEQSSSLVDMAIQELEFPFPAEVMGVAVQVVDASPAKHSAYGLELIVQHGKRLYAVSASSVQLLDPFPEGHLYLAALLDWHSRF